MSESTVNRGSSQDLELFLPQVSEPIAVSGTNVAVAIVKRTVATTARMRDEGLVTEYKTSISDAVTAADCTAEKFAVEALAALRLEDGIPGEGGSTKESQTGRTWMIDPVDGTYNFTTGLGYWCSALALVMDDANNPDEVTLGAVHRPVTGESWVGGPDLPIIRINIDGTVDGLRVTNRPLSEVCTAICLRTTVVNSSEESEVIAAGSWLDAVSRSATQRMLGSASVDMVGVADGRVDVRSQHDVTAWDWLPGYASITDAGSECTSAGRWKLVGPSGQVAELSEVLR